MIAQYVSFTSELQNLYRRGTDDPEFDRIVSHFQVEEDAELADLIEADGRLRLRLAKPVSLDRYLLAIPDLPTRPEPLDAAIDMSLRALAETGNADADVTAMLISLYPNLEIAIREAAALNSAVWSTMTLQRHVTLSAIKELPCDFGPVMEDGVHRYELQEALGEGAFGQVYLAVDRQLSEENHPAFVSIKVLPAGERSPWTRAQLIDEATKARRIDHPNVARVLDRGVSDQDEDFIVYEFVEGGDLGRRIRRQQQPFRILEAVQLVAGMARGVHAAHMAGLVHCDLKPSNIVLTTEGDPKVTDFGIAIRADEQTTVRPEREADLEPAGNLAFMSPEQCRMEPGSLTIPSDIYALGGILFWLLTGELPNGSTPEAIRKTHDPTEGRRWPPAPRSHRPEIDRDLEAVVQRAMAVRPEDRYASAAAVAGDLEAWLRREPIPWTRPSMLRRLALWSRRKPALASAALVTFTVVLTSGFLVRQFAVTAAQERLEKAVAKAGLEQEERHRAEYRLVLQGFFAQIAQGLEEGLVTELLPQIWSMEWFYGPTVLGEGPDRLELWRLRIDVVRKLVMDARATGREHTLDTLLWESALGFWLIKIGEYHEAEPLLSQNYANWKAILAPEDPWLAHLQAIQASAVVIRLTDGQQPSDNVPNDNQELLAAEATLERVDQMLEEYAPGSPIHILVLDHLLTLYGPELLDQPDRHAEIAERREALNED
ncbi:MAG: serine/threonine protein kinase [Planctomycetes bacterium]|nr:serine/threonine protein kinase [Planctomycetota bacterium]